MAKRKYEYLPVSTGVEMYLGSTIRASGMIYKLVI